jgi:hypothetical protein
LARGYSVVAMPGSDEKRFILGSTELVDGLAIVTEDRQDVERG